MPSGVHRLLSVDSDGATGACSACGTVEVFWRTDRGRRVPRCAKAVRSQRGKSGRGKRYPYKKPHGLTVEEARAFREGKTCAICGSGANLVVDHCHVAKKIRGVLCGACNSGLGMFRDSPEFLTAAIAYVEAAAAAWASDPI